MSKVQASFKPSQRRGKRNVNPYAQTNPYLTTGTTNRILPTKAKTILATFGVFGGLTLAITNFSTLDTTYAYYILGLLLVAMSMLNLEYAPREVYEMAYNEDKNKGASNDPLSTTVTPNVQPNYFKAFLSYFFSALGFSMTFGLVYNPLDSISYTALLFVTGVVITLGSRYKVGVHKPIMILEDYILHFAIYFGFTLTLTAANFTGVTAQVATAIVGYLIFAGFMFMRYQTITHKGRKAKKELYPLLALHALVITLLAYALNLKNLSLVEALIQIGAILLTLGVLTRFTNLNIPTVRDII